MDREEGRCFVQRAESRIRFLTTSEAILLGASVSLSGFVVGLLTMWKARLLQQPHDAREQSVRGCGARP